MQSPTYISFVQNEEKKKEKMTVVIYEIKDDLLDQEGGRGGWRMVGLNKKSLV